MTEFLTENQVESYSNALYSLDLSLCDFFNFSKLKNQRRGIRFNNEDEMVDVLSNMIGSLTKGDFQNCFSDWFSRMHECIDVGGRSFGKINQRLDLNVFGKDW